MTVLYDSLTGNVNRFINKLPVDAKKITTDMQVDEDFILITFTTGFGNVPETTRTFLEKNNRYLKAIACSGNKNWGDLYGACADVIAKMYQVPILHKFELSGTPTDVVKFMKGLETIEAH